MMYRFVRATMSFSDIKEMQREPPPKAHNYYWYGNKVGESITVLLLLEWLASIVRQSKMYL